LVIPKGWEPDPNHPGKQRQGQIWKTVSGTKAEAEKELAEIIRSLNRGDYISPSKLTYGEYVREHWLPLAIKPPMKAERTYKQTKGTFEKHIAPELGHVLLQALRAAHLEAYYATKRKSALSEQSLCVHQRIIHSSLEAAVVEQLIAKNVASGKQVKNRPRKRNEPIDPSKVCWDNDQQRTFLDEAEKHGVQMLALFSLALKVAMRKGELLSLAWSDLDWKAATLTIRRTLLGCRNGAPRTNQTKTKRTRVVPVPPETLSLLRAHQQHQSEVKMKYRDGRYKDHGLIFASEVPGVRRGGHTLGSPLAYDVREFHKIREAANLPRIVFHAMRHTAATSMFADGETIKTVQDILGHSKASTTLDTYGHATSAMLKGAVARREAALKR
jgi:integrase